MQTQNDLKNLVRQKYSEIALQDKETSQISCCGDGGCSTETYNIMSDDYSKLEGYNPDADLGLGCGLPTQFAKIKKGDVVIDLGSGAGNDAFIARNETGESGKVIGIDFTPAMIERARQNNDIRGFNNVEFRQGDIENMPVNANTADVIVSNCVLNLVPNKDAVIKEIFRVLKPGGHFSISDIVLEGELPKQIKEAAEMYAGCVAGAIQKQVYLELMEANGFKNITVQKDKAIIIPDNILSQYLSAEQIAAFKQSGTGIRSVTVYADKPVDTMNITILDPAMCCSTGVCGVDVDDQLVATAANVKWLKSSGFDVQRHNISNDSAAFMKYPAAISKLQKEGTNSLPYIFINGELVMSGKYPEKSDWELWIKTREKHTATNTEMNAKKEDASATACCPGSACC